MKFRLCIIVSIVGIQIREMTQSTARTFIAQLVLRAARSIHEAQEI
jgi:hypothetical protein